MKFTKDYKKLANDEFSTIRKNTGFYKKGKIYTVITPTQKFSAQCISTTPMMKEYITEPMARLDADCSKKDLIAMLDRWYGEEFNDYVFIVMSKV